MYLKYFGLKRAPFSIAPDPHYLYMSERHREALAHLLYGLKGGGGFVLLSGEIGAGKTTVCRCFLEQMPAHCNVAYIFNPKLSVAELLQTVCDEFHVAVGAQAASVKDYVDPLNAYLLAQHAAGRNSVLIIDEAQNLSAEVLEQLRLLTNLETSERKLLQIILIGQPELRELLANPRLEQLAQRVVARCHLGALSAAETSHYIAHRLFVAGLTGALPFDTRALARVHAISHGVPRRINLLCDRALLGAYAQGRRHVDANLVALAAAEAFGEGHAAGRRWQPIVAMALVGAVVGAALTYAWLPKPATAAAASATAASGAPPASTPVSEPAVASTDADTPSPAPVGTLRADAWPHPITDEANAWRQLAAAWHLPPSVGDPCVAARQAQVQCYRTRLAPAKLALLDRPGIVTLRLGPGPAHYAILESLNSQQATLRMGDTRVSVTALALAEHWQGEFSTYWRAPAGHEQLLRPGASGPVVDWLAASLARWRGSAPPPPGSARVDEALQAQIAAFQQAQGLIADGAAGPFTLMQLNRVVGLDEPRLAKPVPPSARSADHVPHP